MKEAEVEALVNAIHRCNQLRLPIMIFGAGLPKILKMLGEIKSYSERIFKFEEIGALSEPEAKDAIIKPVEPMGIQYESDALFIFAMVKCGDLPCTIANVAKIMKRSVSSISPYLETNESGIEN